MRMDRKEAEKKAAGCCGLKAVEVVYDVNTLCRLEVLSGKPLHALMNGDCQGLRLLLWAGMRPLVPTLSLEDAGCVMTGLILRGWTLEDIGRVCARGLERLGRVQTFELPGKAGEA